MGAGFDYRDPDALALNGRLQDVLSCEHPITALLTIFPLRIFPSHCLELLTDIYEGKVNFASQMGCTSDALSAVIVPAVLKFVEFGDLISEWKIDLTAYRYTRRERFQFWVRGLFLKRKLRPYLVSNERK